MAIPKTFATAKALASLMGWAPLMGQALPKTFATAKALASLMGWAPLMGQALPRYDHLNPTDS